MLKNFGIITTSSIILLIFNNCSTIDNSIAIKEDQSKLSQKDQYYRFVYSKSLKDVDIFEARRNIINYEGDGIIERVSDDNTFNDVLPSYPARSSYKKSYNKAGKNLVNLLFYKGLAKHSLLEKDGLINSVRYAYFKKPKINRSGNYDEDTQIAFHQNLYQIITKDRNGDKKLNHDDGIDLFVTNYDGRGLRLLVKNFYSYNFPRNQEVIIETRSDNKIKFYKYSTVTGKLNNLIDYSLN